MTLRKMLKLHEGVRSHVYLCSSGYETIGVGRNIAKDGGIGLSEDEIEYLLDNDIRRVTRELSTEFDWFDDLDEVRKNAMIDISFNLGATKLRGFKKALQAMSEQNWREASKQFADSRWFNQVGIRAKRLCSMIQTGEYTNEFV
ncbi:MAG: lysozyme [Flavobacteriaceae bacterium]|nr:lysozyme [Flavobacteriaceae bacterium]|tara:strand:- start:410 stop:841 length:432 start_codon:yes stop_codon:yes gene_type:complete